MHSRKKSKSENQNEELYYFDEKGIYPCRVKKEGGWCLKEKRQS